MIHARTKSAEDTQALAATLCELVQPQDIVVLSGEMGAGKTTFTQGFGQAMGVVEPITSPTFVLMRTYHARLTLHHIDIYRIEYLQEVIDLGLMELLDEGGVAFVEWGEMAAPVLPRDFLEVRLQIDENDDDLRKVTLRGVGPMWSIREKTLEDNVARWRVAADEGDAK